MNRRRGLWRILLAMLWLGAATASLAEEPAPAPAAEPDKPAAEKKEAPGETPKAEKKEEAATEDPTAVVGTPPEFPLKSDTFKSIDDRYESIGDNIDRDTGMMEMDISPMEAVLIGLRASSLEHLIANIDKEATFKHLMKTPEQYRGHVCRLAGILESFKEVKIPNSSGVVNLYRGNVSNAYGQIVTFRSLEPLPAGLKTGQAVQLTGIFLQRFAFLNRDAGEKLTWTPLVCVRRIEPFTDFKTATSGNNPMSNTLAVILFIFIGIATAAFLYMRSKEKVARGNYFTQMKEAKHGAQGVFPKPGAKEKKYFKIVKVEDKKPTPGKADEKKG